MLASAGAGLSAVGTGPPLQLGTEPPAACLALAAAVCVLESCPACWRMHLCMPEACRATFCSSVIDLTFQSDVHSTYLRRFVLVMCRRIPRFTIHLSQHFPVQRCFSGRLQMDRHLRTPAEVPLRVSSLSSGCIGVASGSGTEIGGASTAILATLGFGHNGAPSVCSVAEHGNQYTPRCFSNFAAFGSYTHVLRNYPHSSLATSLDNLDRTRTNCAETTLHQCSRWENDICFIVPDLKLAPISNQNTTSFPHPPCTRSSVAVVSLTGATAKSSVAL